MPTKEISASSAVLKKAAGLDQARNREKYRQQRVEGVQAVRELLTHAPERVRDIVATPEVLAAHADIASMIERADYYLHIGSASAIGKAAPSAQGIFAVAHMGSSDPELGWVLTHSSLLVCCVQANDPGNVGTIIRTADAAGAGGVILGKGSVDPSSPKVIRSAAGSTFHLPVIEADAKEAVTEAKRAGYQVLLADAGGLDIRTPSLHLEAKTLWLVGNEARGFTPEHKSWADVIVSIPMWGKAESLNLAVASGICLYASAIAQTSTP